MRLLPGQLQVGDSRSQDVVDLVTTVLDELVETPQPVVRLLGLVRQGGQPLINGSRLFRAPSGQRAAAGRSAALVPGAALPCAA